MRSYKVFRTLFPVLLVCHALSAAELLEMLPNDDGWRSAKWGMTTTEVGSLFGKEYQPDKRGKNKIDVPVAVLGKLATKIEADGVKYEVTFGYDPSDKLVQITFDGGIVKEKERDALRAKMEGALGSPHSLERGFYGYRYALSRTPERLDGTTWRPGKRLVTFSTMQLKPNVFMTVRRMSVVVRMPASESDVDSPGTVRYSGDVWLNTEGMGSASKRCSIAIDPNRARLKATCGKEIVLDHTLAANERISLESPGIHLRLPDKPNPMFFELGDEAIVLIGENLKDKAEKIELPAGKEISKNTLKDINSKHSSSLNKANRPLPERMPGKAVIVAVRPLGLDENYGWGLQEKIHLDDQVMAVNLAGAYSFFAVDPGEHTVTSQSGSATSLRMNFEPDKIYYFRHAPGNLKQVSEAMGQLILSWTSPSKTERKPDSGR